MTATKKAAPPQAKEPLHKDVEIVYKDQPYPTRDGGIEMRSMPSGKNTPVVLITTPAAHTERIDVQFRYMVKQVCKLHERNGKKYYEVGESDEVMETAIAGAIEILRSLGVQAKRSIEFSPYLHRREW